MLQLLVVGGVGVLSLCLIVVLIVEIQGEAATTELGLRQALLLLLVLLEGACHRG